MRIFGWTADKGGLARIRIQLPLEEIAKHGHQTSFGTIFERHHGDSDTIIGVRIALQDPSMLWAHACGMLNGPFCVFETDDDNLNISQYNRYAPTKDVESPLQFWSRPDVRFYHLANMRIAHRIVTSTPYLADRIQEQTGHPDIVVAPNTIPGWMLDLPRSWERDDPELRYRSEKEVVVGWAGGASHAGDWDWVRSAVGRAIRLTPGSRMHFTGVDYRKELRVPPDRMSHQPWFMSVDEYWTKGLDFDIALAPLRPEAFNRSKSYIKVLEAAARGIPVVASDYGPYSDFVEDGFTGILCKTPKDWTDAIVTLIKDRELRHTMGINAWSKAQDYTIEKNWQTYLEAYTP